jgi:hypothetical protein
MNENEKLLENVDVPYSTRELKVIQESNKKKDHMINLICNIIFTVIYLSSSNEFNRDFLVLLFKLNSSSFSLEF